MSLIFDGGRLLILDRPDDDYGREIGLSHKLHMASVILHYYGEVGIVADGTYGMLFQIKKSRCTVEFIPELWNKLMPFIPTKSIMAVSDGFLGTVVINDPKVAFMLKLKYNFGE